MSADSAATGWYYTRAGSPGAQPTGPLSWEQLWSLAQAGSIAPADLVWNATLPQWLPAAQIPGLLPSAAPPPGWAAPQGGPYYQPSPPLAAPPPGAYGPRSRPAWLLPALISLVVILLAGAGLGVYFGVFWHRDKTAGGGTESTVVARTTTTVEISSTTTAGATTTSASTTTTSASTTTTTAAGGGTWTNLNPNGDVPSARLAPAMAFESATKNIYLFGGAAKGEPDYTFFDDTYYYDPLANAWTTFDPAPAPEARSDAAFGYDEDDGQLILFGGWAGGDSYLDDTWAYDPLTFRWGDLEPEGDQPEARDDAAMAYDPGSGALIMFGGTADVDLFNDTWSFDRGGNSWNGLDPGGSLPPARWGHSMVYCPDTKTMLLFGGMTENGPANDLWAYDPAANTWTELEPTGALPPPRSDQVMVYDAAAERLILFGGWDENDKILGDTWAYDPAADRWTKLTPAGDVPAPRAMAAMAYDRASGKVILFGGFDQERHFNDTWAFSLRRR